MLHRNLFLPSRRHQLQSPRANFPKRFIHSLSVYNRAIIFGKREVKILDLPFLINIRFSLKRKVIHSMSDKMENSDRRIR